MGITNITSLCREDLFCMQFSNNRSAKSPTEVSGNARLLTVESKCIAGFGMFVTKLCICATFVNLQSHHEGLAMQDNSCSSCGIF